MIEERIQLKRRKLTKIVLYTPAKVKEGELLSYTLIYRYMLVGGWVLLKLSTKSKWSNSVYGRLKNMKAKTVLAFPVIVYLNTMNDHKSFWEVLYTPTKALVS